MERELKILKNDKLKEERYESIEIIRSSYLDTRSKHENIIESMIDKCIERELDFTMESTGLKFGEWYFDMFRNLKKRDYKIILVYSQVLNENILVERAYKR